ncbi:cytochrome P450 [Saccharothrix sp. AJ9571]|nr:cytochrome P450 [Saccharothrix sp. AJ9571]
MLSLPELVVSLRVKVFEAVNRDQVITLPDSGGRFLEVYSHPAANGRSRGAELSDLFWYWLSPGPEVHQEHLEAGPRYDDVARTTLRILAGPSEKLVETAARCTAAVLDAAVPGDTALVRLRDLMMPVWADFFYELVFREPCPPEARKLIVGHADDVVTALKCTGLRHPRRRAKLTRYLARRLPDVPHELPGSLSREEQVHYLQGTFFNTAVVQMSEGMAHLLLALAQHPGVQQRLVDDPADERYFAQVLDETLRLFPLFGIAHRIATADIEVGGSTLPEGSVLCFSYPGYHSTGYQDPETFDPSRWDGLSPRNAHHIPFGVAANRPCPAWRVSPLAMRAATTEVLRRFRLDSTVSHTRPLPHRAPCLLSRRTASPPMRWIRAAGVFLRWRDHTESLWRSVVQLVLGTWMVLDARHRRLAGRYFDTHDTQGCPVHRASH